MNPLCQAVVNTITLQILQSYVPCAAFSVLHFGEHKSLEVIILLQIKLTTSELLRRRHDLWATVLSWCECVFVALRSFLWMSVFKNQWSAQDWTHDFRILKQVTNAVSHSFSSRSFLLLILIIFLGFIYLFKSLHIFHITRVCQLLLYQVQGKNVAFFVQSVFMLSLWKGFLVIWIKTALSFKFYH